jgi:hypothetical protein
MGMKMVYLRGVYFLTVIAVFLFLHPPSGKTEESPFDRALERIYALDFEGGYGLLGTTVGAPSAAKGNVERARVLKAIVSLSQTFSNARLWAAYREAVEVYSHLTDRESDVLKAFEAHRSEYARNLRMWTHRLAEDTEGILEERLDVELSIKYKGLGDLPKFVQEGIDRLDTVRRGLLPTPSQSRNIQTSEEYASFLSSLILALGEPFYQPSTTTIITGKVKPVTLLYYCSLWILNASHQVDDDEELISASRKAALRGLELERKYPRPELRGKLMEILGII